MARKGKYISTLELLDSINDLTELGFCTDCEDDGDTARSLKCYSKAWKDEEGKFRTCNFI